MALQYQDMSNCRAKAARYLAGRPAGIIKVSQIPTNLWTKLLPRRECYAFGKFARKRKPGEMQQRYGATGTMIASQRIDVFDTSMTAEGAWMAEAFGVKLGADELVIVPWLGLDQWVGGATMRWQLSGADAMVDKARQEVVKYGLSYSQKQLVKDLLRAAPKKPRQQLRRIAELFR